MIYTKLYLDSRITKPGTPAPLKFVITKNKVRALIPLNIKIHPANWDAARQKATGVSACLNSLLNQKKSIIDTLIFRMESEGEFEGLKASEVKRMVEAKLFRDEEGIVTETILPNNFKMRYAEFAKSRPAAGTRNLYDRTWIQIEKYAAAEKIDLPYLTFEDITVKWLRDFDTFLSKTSPARNARNIHFRNIRAVFNDALDDEVISCYPFRKFKLKNEETAKRSLSVENLRLIFDCKVEEYVNTMYGDAAKEGMKADAEASRAEGMEIGRKLLGSVGPESGEKDVTLGHGERSGQDNDTADGSEGEGDLPGVASDTAGSVAGNRDRGTIRVYEEGLEGNSATRTDNSERDRRRTESERLVETAKDNGQFMERREVLSKGERIPKRSGESEVIINHDSNTVYKIKDPYSKSPMKPGVQPEDAIYEHLVHNKYFPETAYGFEGISEDVGDARIVLSQDYIESVGQPTKEQIDAALAEKGLFPEGKYYYGNDEVRVTDVTGDNAIIGADGKVYFIDPVIDFKKPVREIVGEVEKTASDDNGGPKVEMSVEEAQEAFDGIIERMRVAEENFEEAFGIEADIFRSQLEEDPFTLATDPTLSPDQQQAVTEYINARSALEGIKDGTNEASQNKIDIARQEIEHRTNRDSGMVQPAVMIDGKPVFIVKGKVALYPDGSGLDRENSSQTLVYVDPTDPSGEYKWASINEIHKADEPIDPAEQLRLSEEEIKAEHEGLMADLADIAEEGNKPTENIPEIGNNGGENIPPTTQDAQQEGVGRVDENTELGEEQTALQRIPVDEETGKPKWHEVEPEVSYEALLEKSRGNEEKATGFAKMQLETSKKAVREAEKIKITATDDFDEYDRQDEAKQQAIDHAKAIQQHWERVLAIPEERKAAAEAEAKAIKEAEEAERRALKKADESLARAYDEVKDVPEALEHLKDLEPKTMDEVAALVLSQNKLMWNDEGNRKGVKSETGFGEGERKKMFSMFTSREKGGKSLQKLAEDEMQQMCATYGVPYDNQDARNALIELIYTSSTPLDIKKYIERRRAEQALAMKESILQREAEAEEEFYQTNYGMSKEDHESYEEMKHNELAELHENFNEEEYTGRIADELADIEEIRQKGLEEMDKNFNPEEFYGNIADEIATKEGIEDERRNSEKGGQSVGHLQEDGREGTVENDGRGGEILSGEESDKPRGLVENEGRSEVFGGDGQESIDKNVDLEGGPRGSIGEEISRAEAEVDLSPTDAQKEAGNYKKGHVKIGKFDITIENPKGSVRSGRDRDGKEWHTEMQHTYGYIKGTEGVDGDHIDVFLNGTAQAPPTGTEKTETGMGRHKSPQPETAAAGATGWNGEKVFVVDQYNPDGTFDEHKVMLGFNDKEEAYDAYLSNYEKGWENGRRIDITSTNIEDFEKWIDSSKRKTKPFAEYKTVKKDVQKDNHGNPIGRSLTEKESSELISEMESKAEEALSIELTPDNWVAQFGEEGKIETPIGIVKMGENQFMKLHNRGRAEYFGMIAPTLQTPDVIIEKKAPSEGSERDTKLLFVKTFIKSDGRRIVHFESVTVRKDGMEVSISSHEAEAKDIKKDMQNEKILHISDKLSLSSEWSLTEAPRLEGPDLVPTSDNNSVERQAEREDGQLLILPSENSEEAGALSGPTSGKPFSESKGSENSGDRQEKAPALRTEKQKGEGEEDGEEGLGGEAEKPKGFLGKVKEGLEGIIYEKEFEDGDIYYLEDVREGRKSLAFQTMYKKKKGTDSSDGLMSEDLPPTSETTPDNLDSESKGSENSGVGQEKAATLLTETGEGNSQGFLGKVKEGLERIIDVEKERSSALDEIWATDQDTKENRESINEKYNGLNHSKRQELLESLQNASDEELAELVKDAELMSRLGRALPKYEGVKEFDAIHDRLSAISLNEAARTHFENAPVLPMTSSGLKKPKFDLYNYTSKDKQRPNLQGVYHDPETGMAVSTDTGILIALKDGYDAKKAGRIIDKKGNEISKIYVNGKEFDARFPNWMRIMPKGNPQTVASLTMPRVMHLAQSLKEALKGMKGRDKEEATVALRMPDGTVGLYNMERLQKLFEGMHKLGRGGLEYFGTGPILAVRDPKGAILLMGNDPKRIDKADVRIDLGEKPGVPGDKPKDIFEEAASIAKETQEKKKAQQAKKSEENRIEDFGEKISGARKDALKDLAKNVENVTVQSLIEQPLGKAFKKPDIKKLYESGSITEEEALLAEAVMQGLVLANKKPALTKRSSSKKEIEKWAGETYKGIRLLGEILSGDPSRREKALMEHKENLQQQTEKIIEHIKKLREWNQGIEFKDAERVPDPLEVTRRVLEGIGYRPGDKVDLPLTHVVYDGRSYKVENAGKQSIWFKRYHSNLDDAIATMITAAKLKRGDTDVELPQDLYGLKGTGQRHYEPTGKYSVQYLGKGKFNIKEKIFDNEAEAKDFAEKNNGHIIPQQKATNIFDKYAVTVTNPLTGEKHELKEFNDRMDALAWIDENFEEANTMALEAINKEMGVKGNERSHFYVGVNYVGGERRYVYSVMENDKHNPWPIIKDFETRKEAEEWLKENKERLEKERKERKDAERKIVYFSTEGRDRIGPDYREGKESTPEMYDENFGFRGVQFGNWANQADRREAMDQGFDSFRDLARLTGLPVRAMSLDGELGLAFGARGSGSALAHYEPSEVVINLTKTRGAGSLAHEWWHALDNMLSRRAGVPMGFLTHRNGIDKANKDVAEAFGALMNAVKQSAYGRRSQEKGAYWGQETEMTARLFSEWISEKLRENGEDNGFLARGVESSAQQRYQQANYNDYRNNEIRKAELAGKDPEIMSREEFNKRPESLKGFPYPTAEEVRAFSPYIERVFDALREREQTTGSIANEPRRSYGRNMARTAGRSLFDWADEQEMRKGPDLFSEQDQKERETEIAGEEANRAIDEYSASFSKYLRRSEEIEKELAKEDLEEIERLALEQERNVIEEVILDEKERLTDSLREFYSKNNTPDDAEMLSREMASRVQAEVSVRLNGKKLLDDILTPGDKGILQETSPIEEAKESSAEVKTAGGPISYTAKGHLPDGDKGEFSYVERQFLRSGAFSFTGRDKIRDRGDVAYIFKELENYAIEDVFGVLQREDGSYKIVHVGMGGPTSSIADLTAIRAAYDAFGAEKIWLVHNHPSGVLIPSPQDQQLMRKIEDAFTYLGVETEGIIMDTRSGRYSSFHGSGSSEKYERDFEMEDKPVDVYTFDRADRSREPEEKEKLNMPHLVVDYISKLRSGQEPRVSYLLLNNQMEVVGNFHSSYASMGDEGLAEEMASVGIKYGAKAIIPYGNVELKGVRGLNEEVQNYSFGELRVVDALQVTDTGSQSAYDAGLMEPVRNYGKGSELSEAERAKKIQELEPIEIKPNNLSKDELKSVYSELPNVEKDGREIEFYKSAFKKVYKKGGLSAQAIPALREVLESSILAYSEPDNLGGQTRKDGTEHKEHKNVLSYDNYIGKIKLEDKEYYVRFTVQNEKVRSGTHSFFVSNVDLYEKPTDSQTIPITSRGTTGFDGIPDTKLVEFFERAKNQIEKDEADELSDGKIRFSIRKDAAPKKTGIGYKVFVLKDGKLYPPMVANPEGKDTPVGIWLDADAAPVAGLSKTGRQQVKAGGKGTQGGSGTLAYRPGWHLGEIPYALQFNRKGESGAKELFPKNFVWAEVEYADDVDYQEEAMSYGMNKNGKFQHSLAGLPRLPKDGSYKYRTNPNPETDPWIITGAMKVNRLLTPSEVDEMVRNAGREPQKRQEGAVTDEQIRELNEKVTDVANVGEVEGKGSEEIRDGFVEMVKDAGVPVEMVNAKDAEKIAGGRLSEGQKVYGWTKEGKVFINADEIDPETPLHEYGHLWNDMVRKENPELWERGKELLKETPLWEEVKNDPAYADIKDDEDAIADEVKSRLDGKEGKRLMDEMIEDARKKGVIEEAKAVSLVSRLKKWLSEMFKGLKETLGKWTKKDLKNLTLEEFSRMTIRDLMEGMNPKKEMKRGDNLREVVKHNPMLDDYHTGIREREDVKSFDEILKESEKNYEEYGELTYPDMDIETMREASRTGKITVYSSYPIEKGAFVTPSKMNAEEYAGGPGMKVYSKELNVDDIAWISEDEGEVAFLPEESDVRFSIGGGSRDGDIFDEACRVADESRRERKARVDLKEAIKSISEDLKISNQENLEEKKSAMRKIGGDLNKLRSAMARQREYDESTVKSITDLANALIEGGLLDNIGKGEFKSLLSAAKNVTGKQNTEKYVNRVIDIMVGNQLRNGRNTFSDLLKVKGSRVDARGVEVQGVLDPEGQRIAQVVKKSMTLPKDDIDNRISEALNRMGSTDQAIADEAAIEYNGLQISRRYAEEITESKAEEKDLRESLKQAKEDKAAGQMTEAAYKQYVAATEDAIRQNKIERAEAYQSLIEAMGDVLGESIERAKAWKEAELERVRAIQHNANSDMEGRPTDEHHKNSRVQKIMNNSGVRFLLAPLATFDQMLRMFGKKNVRGEGYLWNRYMRGWVDATEKEYTGYRDALKVLDDKVSEVFGKKMSWGDLFTIDRKLPKGSVKFWDGGEMREHELTQGNMLYIYMTDKMADGRMKLRRMGITEEDIEDIKDFIDPRFIELADWMQDEFLTEKRNEYNEVHKRMFGASMAAIENYFPLKILANARIEEVDVADDTTDTALPATTTGSIIKRRRNNLALDVTGANAFSVILDHLQQMERWAAFAEYNRDLNTLLSYKRFRNQVMNMSSAYGAGKTLWNNFRNVAAMSAGAYRPPIAALDKAAVNIAKGVTAAKVSFRVFTALKQFLSFPAYISDSNPVYLIKNLINPVKSWQWSMKNLPLFEKRWKSRMAGDPRLMKTDMDWKAWRSNVVQIASRIGMSPNAFVDALTVSIGAYSMYESRLKKYLRQGFEKRVAEKRAKQDATILFNQTQQSSEGAFLSTMQVDRSWLSVLFTVFRNSSMSYTRQLYDAVRNLKGRATFDKRPSVEFMAKQLLREQKPDEEGAWSEADWAEARRHAGEEYRSTILRDLVKVGIFGYVLQMAWNLSAYLPYLILGKDEEEKDRMWDDAMRHAMFGSIEGLTGGDVMSSAGQMAVNGEGNWGYLVKDMPMVSDLSSILKKMPKDQASAMNDVINLMVQSGIGVNPQSLTDAVVAIVDACGDDANSQRECALLISRIVNCPPSQIDKIYFDEIDAMGTEASEMTPKEIAERYAEYKMMREAPLTGWMRDEATADSIKATREKRVLDRAKENITGRVATEETKRLVSEYDSYNKRRKAAVDGIEGKERLKALREFDKQEGRASKRVHKRVGEYKRDIEELTDKWLKTKDRSRIQELTDSMMRARERMLEEVRAIAQ